MSNQIFAYPDTNSSRANIEWLNRKFRGQKIAIIGLGGTGSYILDLVAKTPVTEIHLYDDDDFLLHNAFRAPGAIDGKLLEDESGLKKVDYYHAVYSHMHTGVIKHNKRVTPDNIGELAGFGFAFISVDKNKTRAMLTKGLQGLQVPFIDTGLGVNKLEDTLIGTVRVTACSPEKSDHLQHRLGEDEFEGNEYATNIQIADLNSMNAVLAVIKWKKMVGFYQDLKNENNSLYFINTNKLLNEDPTA